MYNSALLISNDIDIFILTLDIHTVMVYKLKFVCAKVMILKLNGVI